MSTWALATNLTGVEDFMFLPLKEHNNVTWNETSWESISKAKSGGSNFKNVRKISNLKLYM